MITSRSICSNGLIASSASASTCRSVCSHSLSAWATFCAKALFEPVDRRLPLAQVALVEPQQDRFDDGQVFAATDRDDAVGPRDRRRTASAPVRPGPAPPPALRHRRHRRRRIGRHREQRAQHVAQRRRRRR